MKQKAEDYKNISAACILYLRGIMVCEMCVNSALQSRPFSRLAMVPRHIELVQLIPGLHAD
jgi:hypothetical protein